MRISDWSSDVCSSDLAAVIARRLLLFIVEACIIQLGGQYSLRQTLLKTALAPTDKAFGPIAAWRDCSVSRARASHPQQGMIWHLQHHRQKQKNPGNSTQQDRKNGVEGKIGQGMVEI